jgi:hypothetical protein
VAQARAVPAAYGQWFVFLNVGDIISKMWGLVYRVMYVTLMCNYGPTLYGIAIHYMLLAA